jgi:hypothetical protein
MLETSHFSIGTSPYYAHQHAIGIDIYDRLTPQNYKVLSPVAGKILEIKEMRAPKPRFNDSIDKEYLTIIQNQDDKDTVFKILHVKPELNVGQKVKPGDPLGKTIKNGYFAPWSSPHIHLELKKPQDVFRAKKGLNFMLNTQNHSYANNREEIRIYEQIPTEIIYVCDKFFLCRFPKDFYCSIKPFYGVKGTSRNSSFILDGGIPQYKHGIIHFYKNKAIQAMQQIYLNNVKIGVLNNINRNYGLVNFTPLKISLNNIPIRGISLFLAKMYPLIKLIPLNRKDLDLKKNTLNSLKIEDFT